MSFLTFFSLSLLPTLFCMMLFHSLLTHLIFLCLWTIISHSKNNRRRWTQFSSCCSLLSVHLVNELIEKYASSLLHDLKWNQIENKTQKKILLLDLLFLFLCFICMYFSLFYSLSQYSLTKWRWRLRIEVNERKQRWK